MTETVTLAQITSVPLRAFVSGDKEQYSPAGFTFPLLKFDVFSLPQLRLSSVHLQKGYFLECDGGVIFCGALKHHYP